MLINSEPIFSEYQFLRLFACISIINGNAIIENHQLERDLVSISRNPDYKALFQDIVKKEDVIFPETSHVNLLSAFQTAYAYGLFLLLDQDRFKSIISLDIEEARVMMEDYEPSLVDKMYELYDELQISKEKRRYLLMKKSVRFPFG